MNKNIFKKAITLSLLGSTLFFTLNYLIPSNSNLLQKSKSNPQINLDEADKLKLNKKPDSIGFSNAIKVDATTEIKDEIVPGELLVKFKDLAQKESFVKENIGDAVVNQSLVTELTSPVTGDAAQDKKDTLDLVSQLKSDPRIAWVEPNLIAHKNFVPNDTKYNDQWALKNTGQPNLGYYDPFPTVISPTPGFDIKAEQAWDVSTGNGTVIAIVDDGIDYTHPDLAPNILRDSGGRILGKNIADNCLYSNADGSDNTACNFKTIPSVANYGHGTAVAGAAAAKGNNNSGISGACPNCKIMPIAVEGLGGASTFNTTNIYNGIVYAINNNAQIINLSLGYGTFNQAISDLIDIAHSYDVIVVAASGNCGLAVNSPTSGCTAQNDLEYPASYPKVISVSGTNPDGRKANFATVNSLVDVSGPAQNIWTTWSQYVTPACGSSLIVSGGSTLCYEAGTSFSAPLASGILGLILGQNPNLSAVQAETALKSGTTNPYILNPSLVGLMGVGNINACGALVGCNSNPVSSSSIVSLSSSSQSNTAAGSINLSFCQGFTGNTILDLTTTTPTNNLNYVSQDLPGGMITNYINTTGQLRLIYTPNSGITANIGTIAGTYKLIAQESNGVGNVGAPIEYSVVYTVINCASSSSVSSTTSITFTQASSVANSTSISSSSISTISGTTTQASSVANSTSVNSSLVQSSSLLSSSSIQASSSPQLTFGMFLPNAPLTGTVGSPFPSFTLNSCNLAMSVTPVTVSVGTSSIGGSITNCIFTPSVGTNILAAFQASNTLTLNGVGIPSLVIPTTFMTPASSLISSSQISSSSILRSVAITGITIVGSQYQISFVPTNYVPAFGNYHTHFYYNTEPITIMNKMYSGTAPYLLNISTKPANATQICSIVGNPDHSILAGSGNCVPIPATPISSSSLASSSSIVSSTILVSSISSSSQIISSSALSSSLISSSRSSSSSSLSTFSTSSSLQSTSSSSTALLNSTNIGGGTITVANNNRSSSSNLSTLSAYSLGASSTSSSSSSSVNFKQINETKTQTKLEYKSEFGNVVKDLMMGLEGLNECAKPLEATVKTTKEQDVKDGNNVYPFGVINFKVRCEGEVKVKIFYPEVKDWKQWQLRKLIFDKAKLTYNWKDFDAKLGFENDIAFVEYSVKDGEYGDSTAKDGFIIDPIGLIKKVDSDNVSQSKTNLDIPNEEPKNLILPRTGGFNAGNIALIALVIMLVLVLAMRLGKDKEQD